jgi:hypothetical protein
MKATNFHTTLSYTHRREVDMNNLSPILSELIITIYAFPLLVVCIWALLYFSFMIYLRLRIRRELGDMPSHDEVSELYERINEQIRNPFGK